MMEVVAIPILMKAVDFLFEEASKILQERRERRKLELEKGKPGTQATTQVEVPNAIQSKEVALSVPINETNWRNSEAEVKYLMSLLEIYTKNYYLAKEQYAKFGSALVPPVIVHNLEEAEDGIAT